MEGCGSGGGEGKSLLLPCPQLCNRRVGGGQSLALLVMGCGNGLVPEDEECRVERRKRVLTKSGGLVLGGGLQSWRKPLTIVKLWLEKVLGNQDLGAGGWT